MNEDARDGNSPTGQALGNLALLVAAPLTIAGGIFGGVKGAKWALNKTAGARGKVAEAAENVVNKVKSAREIKDISKDIKASNKQDSFMKNELKDFADDQRLDEKYIKQNNPKLSKEDIREQARANTKNNIQNTYLNKEIDVTENMDDMFNNDIAYGGPTRKDPDPRFGRKSFDMAHNSEFKDVKTVQDGFGGAPSKSADYNISGDSVRTQIDKENATTNLSPEEEYDNYARNKIKNTPKTRESMQRQAAAGLGGETGMQSSMFDADYGVEPKSIMKEQAHQNVMERNSAFSKPNAPTMDRNQYESPIGPNAPEPEMIKSRKINRNINRGTRTLGAPEINQPTDFTKNITQNTKVNMPEKEFKGFAGYDDNGNPIYV